MWKIPWPGGGWPCGEQLFHPRDRLLPGLKGCSKALGLVPAVWCWLSPGLTGSLPITFTRRSPGQGVREFISASPFPLVVSSCACHEGKHTCLLLQCQVFVPTAGVQDSPLPWRLFHTSSSILLKLGNLRNCVFIFPFFSPLHLVKCRARKVCVCFCTWLSPQTCLAGGCHMRAGA